MYITDNAVMCRFLVDKFEKVKADLKLQDVFYGDQRKIPRTPALCVEPGEKTRELNGAPRRTSVTMTNYLIVYHNPVTSASVIREEDDQRAEAIERFIHADPHFVDENNEDQVIQSLVTSIESGYQQKEGSLYRASRLTVEAQTQEQLPTGGA